MDLYTIVKKLSGSIWPVGKTETDDERFSNLQETMILVNLLIADIVDIVPLENSGEFSRSRAGKKAKEFISSLKEVME